MADSPTGRADIQELRKIVDRISDYDWVSPAVNRKLGELDFQPIVPELSGIAALLKVFAQQDLGLLPQSRAQGTANILSQLESAFQEMGTFSLSQPNAQQRRQQIIENIRGHYNNVFDWLGLPMGVWTARQLDLAQLQATLENTITDRLSGLNSEYDKELINIHQASKDAAETLDAIKKAAGQVGVTQNAKVFEGQASEHLRSSVVWGILTAVMAAITVGWGAVALWGIPIPAGADTSRIVQEAIAKLIVFSGLSYGLVWCARNYSANRHNYVLNKHRQNSLTTFETFVKAAGDDVDTKNAVLLQATTAIFAAQTTGYSSREPDVDQPTMACARFG
jgi:hypothetical protein